MIQMKQSLTAIKRKNLNVTELKYLSEKIQNVIMFVKIPIIAIGHMITK